MDIDIELRLNFKSEKQLQNFRKMAKNVELKTSKTPGMMTARTSLSEQSATLVDNAIDSFLNEMTDVCDVINESNAILRIGIFYDLNETIVLPIRLPRTSIEGLAKFGLGINMTGYPCSNDE